MEGLATQSPHIGAATASQAQQLGLTFTYTPADIQGLAEPAVRGGGGGVPRQHQNLHAAHGVQVQGGLQAGQRPPGMVIAQQPGAHLQMNTSRQQGEERVRHGVCLSAVSIKIMDTPWLWLVSLGMRVNVGVGEQAGEWEQHGHRTLTKCYGFAFLHWEHKNGHRLKASNNKSSHAFIRASMPRDN